ncbi:hypothetical protein Salat_2803400 [Sesamum alatum]|uniref:Uncharacterized protein n=1 Tax=Sesamum alatum TaxID=300844 RepID=A0AAE1XL76_9LAMI|nr:hypothetical protein Salat_2803400 [Sesamum alatum]
MAAAFSSFRTPIASSAPTPRKLDQNRRSNNWWAPIFGWPAEPDYIGSRSSDARTAEALARPETETGRIRPDQSFFKGCFTEEKARELRKRMIETSSFHDVMYHSAIASRLASDVSRGSDR